MEEFCSFSRFVQSLSKKKPQSKKLETEIEFESDAMERFERAVDVVAKSPPQHRVAKKKKIVTAKKKRPSK